MKRVSALLFVACALLGGFVVSASAGPSAPYKRFGLSAPYTFNGCGGGAHYVDPINVLWFGPNAVVSKVAHGLEVWGKWTHDDYKSPFTNATHVDYQYIGQALSGACRRDSAQRADGCAACDRNHVRLFSTTSRANRTYIVGDAHHDQTVISPGSNCPVGGAGHVASDFNGPREDIQKFWSAHNERTYYRYWGNTRPLKQCDDSFAHSNGYVLYAGT